MGLQKRTPAEAGGVIEQSLLLTSPKSGAHFISGPFLKGKSMNHDETRKYIHDLANSFSIIDASLTRVITLISRNNPQLADEIQRLRKADEYVKKSVHTLKQLREHVHAQSNAEKSE
jgi:hypothetical protein